MIWFNNFGLMGPSPQIGGQVLTFLSHQIPLIWSLVSCKFCYLHGFLCHQFWHQRKSVLSARNPLSAYSIWFWETMKTIIWMILCRPFPKAMFQCSNHISQLFLTIRSHKTTQLLAIEPYQAVKNTYYFYRHNQRATRILMWIRQHRKTCLIRWNRHLCY